VNPPSRKSQCGYARGAKPSQLVGADGIEPPTAGV
jgi:hypothetical protein